MKRKRAIKLLMAADGNGASTASREALDKIRKGCPKARNIEIAAYGITKMSDMSFENGDLKSFVRVLHVASSIRKAHDRETAKPWRAGK